MFPEIATATVDGKQIGIHDGQGGHETAKDHYGHQHPDNSHKG
jgi:hypothetical protein